MLHRSSDLAYTGRGSLRFVIGCDEAGRGPLAGPVVAAACLIVDPDFEIEGICDSKATTESEREELYEIITSEKYKDKILWAAQVLDHKVIDEINILEASLRAMRESAESVLKAAAAKGIKPTDCIGLIDGNKIPANFPSEVTYVIKGDSKVYSIAMASIIAKVTRDRIMYELDKEFPVYNLGKHKGYPTMEHRQLLMAHGPCRVHRLSYGPVRQAFEKHGGYTDGTPSEYASISNKATEKPSKPITAPAAKKNAAARAAPSPAKAITKKEVVDSPGSRRSPRRNSFPISAIEELVETTKASKATPKNSPSATPSKRIATSSTAKSTKKTSPAKKATPKIVMKAKSPKTTPKKALVKKPKKQI